MTDESEPEKKEVSQKIQSIVGLDDLVHSPVRLALLMFLLPRAKATFIELQMALGLTAGNLSSHIKKFEQNNFVYVQKAFVQAKPTTIIYLTPEGKEALIKYASIMTEAMKEIAETNE